MNLAIAVQGKNIKIVTENSINQMPEKKHLSVAVGVIENEYNEILITQRPSQGDYANYWEFPGGKVEPNEIPRQALARELHEELGIEVQRAVPLIRLYHDYGTKLVRLDVWRIVQYQGEPHGRERQPIAWLPAEGLLDFQLLPANKPIVSAIRLPSRYVITPTGLRELKLYEHVEECLATGEQLIRFRQDGYELSHYHRMIPRLISLCHSYGGHLMIDGSPTLIEKFPSCGLHITSRDLFSYSKRPIPEHHWFAASCHNLRELQQAEKIGADFAVLSPVFPTASHPDAKVLGWNKFLALVDPMNIPVYALGGMKLNSPAIWFGAQGVAGIRFAI